MTNRNKKVADLDNRYTKKENANKKIRSLRRTALFRRLLVMGIAFFIVGGALVYTYTKQTLMLKDKQEQKVKVDRKLASLQDKENLLNDQILKLHDDNYIAKLARSEYYLSKNGEIVFKIDGDKDNSQETDE
ncbi:Septum formation initiator [Listeria grayi]|nr:septum formation initiator family protein [Listeria grayi]VEI30852.1 Septum formation initiator [Listeria grayi]